MVYYIVFGVVALAIFVASWVNAHEALNDRAESRLNRDEALRAHARAQEVYDAAQALMTVVRTWVDSGLAVHGEMHEMLMAMKEQQEMKADGP